MKTGAARRLEPVPEHPAPEDFVEEIRTILESGTLSGAREVAARGLELYPRHPELLRLHHSLRPFEVKVNAFWRASDPEPSFDWLRKRASEYRGKWVALDGGELVAVSDSFDEARQALRDRDPRNTLLHFVD